MRRARRRSVPRTRAPGTEGIAIRTRRIALSLAVCLSLAACGTWDPTASTEPEATRTTPIEGGDVATPGTGTAELTVGDGTYNFDITDCYADPEGGIRFTGRSADGDAISGEYDPEAPDDANVVVTNSDGVDVFTSDTASSSLAPEFQMTEDGFTATGTFVSDSDEQVEGSLSGAC